VLVMSYQLAPSNQLQFEVSRVRDDIIIIVVGEGECIMAKKIRNRKNLPLVLKIEHMISTEALSCTYSNWLTGN